MSGLEPGPLNFRACDLLAAAAFLQASDLFLRPPDKIILSVNFNIYFSFTLARSSVYPEYM